MSITRLGKIGPDLVGAALPATFTTDTLVTANTALLGTVLVFRGFVRNTASAGAPVSVTPDSQPAFVSPCYNSIPDPFCYSTDPIYEQTFSRASAGVPEDNTAFVAVVVNLVNVPIGQTFTLDASGGGDVYCVGEAYTGTTATPTEFGITAGPNTGTIVNQCGIYTFDNNFTVPSNYSMLLNLQYTSNRTNCCGCNAINLLYQSGDAFADGTWDDGSTDSTFSLNEGATFTQCNQPPHQCVGYSANQDFEWQVLLGHDAVTPGSGFSLHGEATSPADCPGNTCRIRHGNAQYVFYLRNHDPLQCCPPPTPVQATCEGELSFQAGDGTVLASPQEYTDAALGKVGFRRV